VIVMKIRDLLERMNRNSRLAVDAWGLRIDATGIIGCLLAALLVLALLQ
jgi:hypothetical protein